MDESITPRDTCGLPGRVPVVFAFAGQGSQTYQMGKALFENHPCFRHWMLTLDREVRQRSGGSVVEKLYSAGRAPSDTFDDIQYTHPAIFMVEYSLAQVLIANGIEPDAVIGASLGELCAATIAGLVTLDQAIDVVVSQATVFDASCPPGGMLAVLASLATVRRAMASSQGAGIAAFNTDAHFVIAGPHDVLHRVQLHLRAEGATTQRLPVRQAFHSAMMEPVRPQLEQLGERIAGDSARIPFISCLTGGPVERLSRTYAWELIREPIRVAPALSSLERKGAHLYLDLSPGGTFANLIRYSTATHQASRAYAVLTPFGRDVPALEAALQAAKAITTQRVPVEERRG